MDNVQINLGKTDADARRQSVSSDATASDLREMYDESNLKFLKPNVSTLSALCIFVALFILLTAMLALYKVRKSLVCVTMANVFALAQFLCVAFFAFALFTNERTIPEVAFGDDPLTWAQGHAAFAAAFAMVFLPIFVVQLVLLTRYANKRSTYNERHGNLQAPSKIAMFAAYPGF